MSNRTVPGDTGNNNSTKNPATSPLSGSPSNQKGSVGTDNQVTAAAELLGIDNISQQNDSVKETIVSPGTVPVDTLRRSEYGVFRSQ